MPTEIYESFLGISLKHWPIITSIITAIVAISSLLFTMNSNRKQKKRMEEQQTEYLRGRISLYSATAKMNTGMFYLVIRNVGITSLTIDTFQLDNDS